MNPTRKIALLQKLNSQEWIHADVFYDILEKCDAIKTNYYDYLSSPIDCDYELRRLATANYDLCCVLITMLLREDHFDNGAFDNRQRRGQVKPIIERMITLLSSMKESSANFFSEKALKALDGFYVYALADPRDDKVFYIGKGTGNRVFDHEKESEKLPESEKAKLQKIREIENAGFSVKRLIVNWGMSEKEAFAAEAALINLLKCMPEVQLTNAVAGHHVHECLTTEEFELFHGAVSLQKEDIKHNILVIKINKLYKRGMADDEIYDSVRGFWKASMQTIKKKKIEYVFGVYNGLIVGVYKPDSWHYGREMIDVPQRDIITTEGYERLKDRVYFICKDYKNLDTDGAFYLHKSIADLQDIQSAQNPITYLSPLSGSSE